MKIIHRKSLGLAVILILVAGFVTPGTDITADNTGTIPASPEVLETPGVSEAADLLTPAPDVFIENRGQINNDVIRIYAGSGSVWFTDAGAWLRCSPAPEGKEKIVLLQDLKNSQTVTPAGAGEQKGHYNYFYGPDPAGWITKVPGYGEVYYNDIYDSMDIRYYIMNGELKYDLILRPGAVLDMVRISYQGAEGLSVNDDGDLVIHTALGDLVDSAPYIYQHDRGMLRTVEGRFVLFNDHEHGFEITGQYDKDLPLVIDPSLYLENSTFVGGGQRDYCNDMELGPDGGVFITGYTMSDDFPTRPGVYNETYGAYADIFVFKMNSTFNNMDYSTYIGSANGAEYANAMAVDGAGCVYLTGRTNSSEFPVTAGAFNTTYNGSEAHYEDAFVLKLDPAGSSLVYSTYLGGSYNDIGNDIMVDSAGNAYLTGMAQSRDFPVTQNAYDKQHNGGSYDMFATKLNHNGTKLVYSTYIGGSSTDHSEERGIAIYVDAAGNAIITGATHSSDFPAVGGAYDYSHNGEYDVAVFKLNETGSQLIFSTFVGGTADDYPVDIDVDGAGNIYVAGYTTSSNFPTTPGAYDEDPDWYLDTFVFKLSSTASQLMFSTCLGVDGGHEVPDSISVDDPTGETYVSGKTTSAQFPVTGDAYQVKFGGVRDAFMLRLGKNGSKLMHSTFLGGLGQENTAEMELGADGYIYIAGTTGSTNFPSFMDEYDPTFNGVDDAFISRLSYRPKLDISDIRVTDGVEPVINFYPRYTQYTIEVYVNADICFYEIHHLNITITPVSVEIKMAYDTAADRFITVTDTYSGIELFETSSVRFNYKNRWVFQFNFTVNWTYPGVSYQGISAYARGIGTLADIFNDFNAFKVNKNVYFRGVLTVKDQAGNKLNGNSLVRGGSQLTFTGLKVVHEGTEDIYPPRSEYRAVVWDDLNNSVSQYLDQGENISLTIATPAETYKWGFGYTLNLSGPAAEYLMLEEYFRVYIDNDGVSFYDPVPAQNKWQTSRDASVGITISDNGGSEVYGPGITYSYSHDNGDEWSSWMQLHGYENATTIKVTRTVSFLEGTDNLVKWRAGDVVGNMPLESGTQRVMVDSEEPYFLDPYPSLFDVSTEANVTARVKIQDDTSGVNASTIEYAVTYDRGDSWSSWRKVTGYTDANTLIVQVRQQYPNGSDNMIRFRAKDVAGNGYSQMLEIFVRVDLPDNGSQGPGPEPEPGLPVVEHQLPLDGATINSESVTLRWRLGSAYSGEVKYNIYFGDTYPPPLYRENYESTDIYIDDLQNKFYRWLVVPVVDGEQVGSVLGHWGFKIEYYNVEIAGPVRVDVQQGRNIVVSFEVHNRANSVDAIDVEFEPIDLPRAYFNFYWGEPRTIQGRTYQELNLGFKIPSDARVGTYYISLTAISTGNTSVIDEHKITVKITGKEPMAQEETDESVELFSPDMWFCCIAIIFVVIVVVYAIYNETRRQKQKSGYPKYQWYQQNKWDYRYPSQQPAQTQPSQPPATEWRETEEYYWDGPKLKKVEDEDRRGSGLGAGGSEPELESSQWEKPISPKAPQPPPPPPEEPKQPAEPEPPVEERAEPPEVDDVYWEPEFREPDFKERIEPDRIQAEELPEAPPVFDSTEELRKKPVEQLTEREINTLRVENMELSDKLYALETERAMGKISRDEFKKKRLEILISFLKK